MSIKWIKRSGLNPQAILDRIDSIKKISSDGRISYSGFEYHEIFASLFSLLDVPTSISTEVDMDSLVSKALGQAAQAGPLTKEGILKRLNDVAKNELSTREIEYALLTSISMGTTLPFRRLNLESVVIKAINGPFPKKYDSRNSIIKPKQEKLSLNHHNYTKIIISTKAKSFRGAATKALNAIDLARSFASLFANSSMELMGSAYAPINKIRLGQVHTLHLPSGKAATGLFWYDPNFSEAKAYEHKNPETLKKHFHWCLKQLDRCPYQVTLKEGLLRYVRSLDESDHNSAAIKLWGALEALASPGDARYDKIIKRCSFLFAEVDYHYQILEHLREFRNRSIHAGDQSERAKTFCYQMQFYFRELVLFHLSNAGSFKNIEEANDFLDLPTDAAALLARKKQVIKALRFRRIESN